MQELEEQRVIMFAMANRIYRLESQGDSTDMLLSESGVLWQLLPLSSHADFEKFDRGLANNKYVSTNLVHGVEILLIFVPKYQLCTINNTSSIMLLFQLKERLAAMISGLPRGQRVYKTMEAVFSDELIPLFSWAGRRNKYMFESTFVERVVTEALCKHTFFGNTLAAQGAIKNHFKNLRGRMERRQIRESPASEPAARRRVTNSNTPIVTNRDANNNNVSSGEDDDLPPNEVWPKTFLNNLFKSLMSYVW